MNQDQLTAYRELKDENVQVTEHNQIRFNSGSEMVEHLCLKAITGYIGHMNGYRVGSEVELPHGEIDVLLWGHPDRLTYAVEVETSPTQDVIQDKLNRYVHTNTVIDELIVINVNDAPLDVIEMAEYVSTELGLEL